jgi:hypothetical protein
MLLSDGWLVLWRAVFLPQTPEELEAIMRSPQLRSTLGSLTGALQTENFQSIMSNFGLDMTRGIDAINA